MRSGALAKKYLQLTLREKVLILVSGLAVMWLASFNLIVDGQYQEWRQQISQGQASQHRIAQTQAQINDIELVLNREANSQLKQQIGRLKIKNQSVNEQLLNQELALVSKSGMIQILKSFLLENTQLKLMSLQSIAPQPILLASGAADNKNKQQAEPLLYKHAIVVQIEGSYFSILKFLQQIEQASDKILWQAINYTVSEYPTADVTIEVYTLSTDKEFISVNY